MSVPVVLKLGVYVALMAAPLAGISPEPKVMLVAVPPPVAPGN